MESDCIIVELNSGVILCSCGVDQWSYCAIVELNSGVILCSCAVVELKSGVILCNCRGTVESDCVIVESDYIDLQFGVIRSVYFLHEGSCDFSLLIVDPFCRFILDSLFTRLYICHT